MFKFSLWPVFVEVWKWPDENFYLYVNMDVAEWTEKKPCNVMYLHVTHATAYYCKTPFIREDFIFA